MNKLSNKLSALTGILICLILPLQAQTVPFTFAGTSPVVLQMDSYGTLSSIGTFGTGTLSLSGANTMMLWYPGKAAFRAGNVTGTQWNDSNVGQYSTAFGYSTTASGACSMAFGGLSVASGGSAIAMGWNTLATNYNSIAMNESTQATGYDAVAMGGSCIASGTGAFAMGYNSHASGSQTFAIGDWTSATGNSATAAGNQTVANSDESFVIGQFNVGLSESGTTPSLTSWVSSDPLFEIGNGTSTAFSDALVVYKDGIVAVHTKLRCAQAGDISMGSFTTGTAP